MRYGELTAFEERPHSPYYGTADATQLYVVLLDEYERWTGDAKLVRDFEFEARAALNWIDEYADLQGNGYISYKRRNEETGLENQCWKDSWDSISYRDGRLPGFPRATCELQGYAYDAKVRGARLARSIWKDPAFADRLEKEAADLKRRFNRDFWIEKGGYYAVDLDADGRRVDSLTSNIGHLLWSGIVERSKAKSVARHLMSERLFSGWGVRTLAEGEGRYNPIGYHVGAVWPFDNSIIAWGLRRYGFKQEAAQIAAGILAAAQFFDGRLPEAFAGYPRQMTKYPVLYPTACSPQAWSTGAPLLFLRTMLGLKPVGERIPQQMTLDGGARRAGRHGARQPQLVEQVEQFQHAGLQQRLLLGQFVKDPPRYGGQLVDREVRPVVLEQLHAHNRPGRADGGAEEFGGHVDPNFACCGKRCHLVQGLGIEQHAVHVEHNGGDGSRKRHCGQHLCFPPFTQPP